jgi:hypothetical protein
MTTNGGNVDRDVVAAFGDEWSRFDQLPLPAAEHQALFGAYFAEFPWDRRARGGKGAGVCSKSRRWSRPVAPRVGTLRCWTPAPLMGRAGLEEVEFHEGVPYWCAVGWKGGRR